MANQTRQLAELLSVAGAEVVVVATTPPYRPAWVARLRGFRALLRLAQYAGQLWQAAGGVQVLHLMANSGWSWHLFAMPAIWICSLRRVPVVVNYRGGEAASFLQNSAGWVRWSMRRAAALVVPSGFLEAIFRSHGMAASVLPNIVDLDRFAPAPGRVPGLHIIVTRNLEPIYDNASALLALAQLRQRVPAATMTIAGSGPEEGRLKRLAVRLELNDAVRFAGRLDREEIAVLYRSADVSLNPSLVDNMPNSLLEALASGVPVVSSDVGGVPYMVKHEHDAMLVPAGSPDRMAEAIARIFEDSTLRNRLVAAGLETARRHSWQRVAPVLARIYSLALEHGK
jgi:glycosyltransferase involved in cell wall biosynthesis